MEKSDLSVVRKFLMWYFRYPPYNPYVDISFTVDFSESLKYLESIQQPDRPRISIQHFITAVIGRVYKAFPQANACVIGKKIFRFPHVGVVIPVDKTSSEDRSTPGGEEVGAVLIEKAEERSLWEIAESTRKKVRKETGNAPKKSVLQKLMPYTRYVPQVVLSGALGIGDRLMKNHKFFKKVHSAFPITVVVSNVGAILPKHNRIRMQSASFTPPSRFLHLGTFLGILPIQDEIILEDGKAVARPVLPIAFIFDHRLFDGVMCGRIVAMMTDIFQNPAETFGEFGERKG